MESFVTEQRNHVSVHVLPTRKYINRYIHLSIVNVQGRIPPMVFAVIMRMLFKVSSVAAGKRELHHQLWSIGVNEIKFDLEHKGDMQVASIRMHMPADVLPRTQERMQMAMNLLAELLYGSSLAGGSNSKLHRKVWGEEAQIQEELIWAGHYAGYNSSAWDEVVRGRCMESLGYIGRPTAQDLKQLRTCVQEGELKKWYSEVLRSPFHVHIIGDVQPDTMIRQVLDTFMPAFIMADNEHSSPVILNSRSAEQQKLGEMMLELADIQQCKLNVAFTTGVTYGSSDYAALFLFHSLFGASPASRLNLEIRERKQWVYQIYSTLDDYRGTLHVTTGTSSSYVTDVLEAIDAQWMRLCGGDINEAEMNRAVQNMMHYVQVGLDLPEQMVKLHLDRLLHQVEMTTQQFLEAVSCVTSEEIAVVASRMNKALTWILYPESEYTGTA